MTLDQTAEAVIDASIKLHRDLGPGLLESVYEAIFEQELLRRRILVLRQTPIAFTYDGLKIDNGFRIDLLVGNQVIVELKALESVIPAHKRQVLTYLKIAGLQVRLLLDFGAVRLKDGIHRIVDRLPAAASPALRINNIPAQGSILGNRKKPTGFLAAPPRPRDSA